MKILSFKFSLPIEKEDGRLYGSLLTLKISRGPAERRNRKWYYLNQPLIASLNYLILNRKIFTFRDDEGIENCPIIFFMALAIADKAFQNNFTSLRQIYELVVPIEKTDRIRLKWNKVWAKRAVFRDVEHTIAGVCISETKSLRYQKHRHIFIGLGRTCRFRKRLQWYDLRRGSGKGLNGKQDFRRKV